MKKRKMDMKKERKIYIVIIIILFSALICMSVYTIIEKKRLAQEPYFTKHKISVWQVQLLEEALAIYVFPDALREINTKQWPDFSHCQFMLGEGTKERIAVLNYYLFYYELSPKGTETAKSYGLSDTNPITWYWIFDHPHEAAHILEEFDKIGMLNTTVVKVKEADGEIEYMDIDEAMKRVKP